MTRSDKLTVVLINVVMDGDYQYEQEIPIGLAHIGAFLRQHDYSVLFKQCFASRAEEQFDSAAKVAADVYGFQLNMANYLPVKSVVERIKSRRPEAITIFGGPFLVSLSEDILRNEPLYDFIVIGEGEETVLELLQAIEGQENDFSYINGLVWRDKSGTVVKNELRSLIEDLDTLPFPARDFLENAQRDPKDNGLVESVRMVTSRGCIGRCSFCCVNFYSKVQKGKIWRGRSPRNVVDELEYLSRTYKAKLFNFSDSSFEDPGEQGKERSRQICEEIIRRGIPISAKIYLRCETMKSREDIELLKLYKKAGIDILVVGVESGSDYELRLYEKRATLDDNYRTATILKELDLFYVLIGFIMFGPNSTMETLKSNIEFLYKWGFADNLQAVSNTLMLIRDSKLYRILMEEGRVIESGKHWELPRYVMNDRLAERMSKHWGNLFARFPVTGQVNKLQVNIGNLVSRMTNPMNADVLYSLKDEFLEFKDGYVQLSKEFGKLQHDYFVYTLIESDCSAEKLGSSSEDFFIGVYGAYLPLYDRLYNDFLDKIVKSGFGLSGLVFKHFTSAMIIQVTEKTAGDSVNAAKE